MKITEIRVKMVADSAERLRAFCSVTFDDAFVVRDLKVIEGDEGPFVAMPSRKLCDRCTRCGEKNHLRSKFCNECGQRMNPARAPRDPEGRIKLYADVAHPINVECREELQASIIEAYQQELLDFESDDDSVLGGDDDYEFDDEPSTEGSGFDELVAELRSPNRNREDAPKPEPVVQKVDRKPTPRRDDTRTQPVDSQTGSKKDTARRGDSTGKQEDDDFAAGLDWEETPTKPSKARRASKNSASVRDVDSAAQDETAHGKSEQNRDSTTASQQDDGSRDHPENAADDGFASGIL